jgi:hypothetical protein
LLHVAPTGAIRSYWSYFGAMWSNPELLHCSTLLRPEQSGATPELLEQWRSYFGAIGAMWSNGRSNESNVEQWSNGRLRARAILSNPGAIDSRVYAGGGFYTPFNRSHLVRARELPRPGCPLEGSETRAVGGAETSPPHPLPLSVPSSLLLPQLQGLPALFWLPATLLWPFAPRLRSATNTGNQHVHNILLPKTV